MVGLIQVSSGLYQQLCYCKAPITVGGKAQGSLALLIHNE